MEATMKLKLGLLLTLFAANSYCDSNSKFFGDPKITQQTFDAYFPFVRALVNLNDNLTHEERAWIFEKMIHGLPEAMAQEVNKNPDLTEHFAKAYKSYKDKSDSLINKHYIDILVWLDFITNFFGSFASAWQNLTDEQRDEFKNCFQRASASANCPEDKTDFYKDSYMISEIMKKSDLAAQREGYPAFAGLLYECTMKYSSIK